MKNNNLELFACKNSNSIKYIYGTSSSGRTKISNIKFCECSHPDELFKFCLDNSSPDKISIVCYNDIESSLIPSQVMNYIENILNIEELDIFYLTKYCDASEINRNVFSLNNHHIIKVISPHGLECLLLTQKGKEKLKNVIVQDNGLGLDFALNAYCEKLNAYSSYPVIFNYRIDEDNKNEKIKRICYRDKDLKKPKGHTRNQTPVNLVWFIFMIILFIISFIYLFEDIDDIDTETKFTILNT